MSRDDFSSEGIGTTEILHLLQVALFDPLYHVLQIQDSSHFGQVTFLGLGSKIGFLGTNI